MPRPGAHQRWGAKELQIAFDRLDHPVVLKDVAGDLIKLTKTTTGLKAAVVEQLNAWNESQGVDQRLFLATKVEVVELRLLIADRLLNAISQHADMDPAQLRVAQGITARGRRIDHGVAAQLRSKTARRFDLEAVNDLHLFEVAVLVVEGAVLLSGKEVNPIQTALGWTEIKQAFAVDQEVVDDRVKPAGELVEIRNLTDEFAALIERVLAGVKLNALANHEQAHLSQVR